MTRILAERRADVVAVLVEAFHDYPVMRYTLKDAGDDYEGRLNELVTYLTESRLARGYPVLGVEVGRRLTAAANLTPPERAPAPPELKTRWEQLREHLGDPAIARFEAFADATERFAPRTPHYEIGMIGVRDAARGTGHARLLLEAIHELSATDPVSTGVALTTETPDNLSLYEYFGYEVLGFVDVEELRTWTLFRPDER